MKQNETNLEKLLFIIKEGIRTSSLENNYPTLKKHVSDSAVSSYTLHALISFYQDLAQNPDDSNLLSITASDFVKINENINKEENLQPPTPADNSDNQITTKSRKKGCFKTLLIVAVVLCVLGWIYLFFGNYRKDIPHPEASKTEARSSGAQSAPPKPASEDWLSKCTQIEERAQNAFRQQDYQLAKKEYKSALSLVRRNRYNSDKERELMRQVATCDVQIGQAKKTQQDEQMVQLNTVGDKYLAGKVYSKACEKYSDANRIKHTSHGYNQFNLLIKRQLSIEGGKRTSDIEQLEKYRDRLE
ncbi:MAG: hypothetical protein LBD45_09230 [Bacteroidales bacterium]|jgi:hypothetical protein|nr:hypothetical protein [Bacteroidales bacterium]